MVWIGFVRVGDDVYDFCVVYFEVGGVIGCGLGVDLVVDVMEFVLFLFVDVKEGEVVG